MEHCDECGFTYADHGTDEIAFDIRALGGQYEAVLTAPTAGESRLKSRPAPAVWSAVEYGCHVRDVLLAQRERLLLALVENEPTFVPIYRDQRVDLARYGDETPLQVAREIAFASSLLAWVLSALGDDDWNRTCVYNFPEPAVRTVLWLAQHTFHEGEHHLQDIARITSAPRSLG